MVRRSVMLLSELVGWVLALWVCGSGLLECLGCGTACHDDCSDQ